MPHLSAASVLVTGANRGLGFEWVCQLAETVDHLVATCRRPDSATRLQERASAHPDTVSIVPLDVTEPAAIERVAGRVEREVGVLDLLVNNAGISGGGPKDRFGTVDQATMTQVLQVNTTGPHLLVQACTDLLRQGGREGPATILNITSTFGSIADAGGGGWHSYRASKAALNMLTRVQADEFRGDGVVAIAMNPGWVRTDMGGNEARLSTEESVSGMIDVVADLSLDDTGRFLTHDGREMPW